MISVNYRCAEGREAKAEPVFVNVDVSQDSIQNNRFRQAGNQFVGSLKVLQIQKQEKQEILGFSFLSIVYRTVNQLIDFSAHAGECKDLV